MERFTSGIDSRSVRIGALGNRLHLNVNILHLCGFNNLDCPLSLRRSSGGTHQRSLMEYIWAFQACLGKRNMLGGALYH